MVKTIYLAENKCFFSGGAWLLGPARLYRTENNSYRIFIIITTKISNDLVLSSSWFEFQ